MNYIAHNDKTPLSFIVVSDVFLISLKKYFKYN